MEIGAHDPANSAPRAAPLRIRDSQARLRELQSASGPAENQSKDADDAGSDRTEQRACSRHR